MNEIVHTSINDSEIHY